MQLFKTSGRIDVAGLDGIVDLTPTVLAILSQDSGREGEPFVLAPDGEHDEVLNSVFRALASMGVPSINSQRNYAHQILLAHEYVTTHCRRRRLCDASWEDLEGYKRARRNGVAAPVQPNTWNVQVAALEKYFEHCVRSKWIPEAPFRRRRCRVRVGGHYEFREVNALYEPVASDDVVRCITMPEYVFFRDFGLGGLDQDDARQGDGRRVPRCAARDVALAELLVTTGMRIGECVAMFPEELPDAGCGGSATAEALLASATTKGGKARKVLVARRVLLEHVEPYRKYDRAKWVEDARSEGAYSRLPARHALHGFSANKIMIEVDGAVVRRLLDGLKEAERRRVFRMDGAEPAEPALLWLGEAGMPLDPDAARRTFARACGRCNAGDLARKRFGRPMQVTPHTLRHTFAVAALTQYIRDAGLSLRRTEDAADLDRERQRRVLQDPVARLRDRLGHSSVETTYRYLTYLEDAKATAFAAVQGWSEYLHAR